MYFEKKKKKNVSKKSKITQCMHIFYILNNILTLKEKNQKRITIINVTSFVTQGGE